MLNKEKILTEAQAHLAQTAAAAKAELAEVEEAALRLRQRVKHMASIDGKVEAVILANKLERAKQLEQVCTSPYFVRCDARLGDEHKRLYFGKFQMVEAGIYSWVAPIAQLRFESIGPVKYKLPGGGERSGELTRKDQFMAVDGKLIFMASEATGYDRTLIHQERLSAKKSEFVLPEIIARMEKAQDEVIRADHHGSFLISGPAGSGKTTLAFHRIAYLAQSPDTAKLFPGFNIMVFVQDESTKRYFSAILPQLGIEEVAVVTFEEWALDVLDLPGYSLSQRYGRDESSKDRLEYFKHRAMKDVFGKRPAGTDGVALLKKAYRQSLPADLAGLAAEQLDNKLLDRFDLTILLSFKMKDGRLATQRRVVVEDKKGNLKMANKNVTLAYSFAVIDEAENYLAEQIQVVKACMNENKSVLYVGDLAQQTKIGTIKRWEEVGENFDVKNRAVLDKIYRNTREILQFVRQEGYDASIPTGLRQGPPVKKQIVPQAELPGLIEAVVSRNSEATIGILYESRFEDRIKDLGVAESAKVRCLTFNEAQGVEFEVVVLCRFKPCEDSLDGYPDELRAEKEKIQRDLWYVALTRSMDQLYVWDVSHS